VKALILWEANIAHTPKDPEERMKLWMSMLESVGAGVDSGETEMGGISLSGIKGSPFPH